MLFNNEIDCKKLIQLKLYYKIGITLNHENFFFLLKYFCNNHQNKWVSILLFHGFVAYRHFMLFHHQ
jgi:hypothetical protein